MSWKKNLIIFTFLSISLIIVSMCSKLKKEMPTEPVEEVQLHQAGFIDPLSENFHGVYIRQHDWSLEECRQCHGDDYGGGTSESSCNIENCHPATPEACITCHGGVDNESGAPPEDLNNNIQKNKKGVGAHTAHLESLDLSDNPIACNTCHKVPKDLEAEGHIDGDNSAELIWSEFVGTDNLNPAYSDSSCQNTYCHGASLTGGSNTAPIWTQTEPLACNSCHGQPPESGAHEAHLGRGDVDCNTCHEGYLKNSEVNKSAHINGSREVKLSAEVGGTYSNGVCANTSCHGSGNSPDWDEDVTLGCTGCHGGVDNNTGSPPVDLNGNTAVTNTGVGAHTAHVSDPTWGRSFDCQECHIKPADVNAAGHVDSNPPAEIVWGDLATTEGQSPDWNGTTCANVYCHGSSLAGGSQLQPNWSTTDDLNCDACHGLPPMTGAHEQHLAGSDVECSSCHAGYVINSEVNDQQHVNGMRDVQLDTDIGGTYANGVCSDVRCHGSGETPNWYDQAIFTCVSCHGGLDNNTGAPPYDLMGNSAATARGVGAHTVHVSDSRWGSVYDCSECHINPTAITAEGHIDLDPYAEINWGDFAGTGGLSPMWDGASCSDVYCHGGTLEDGSNQQPLWTSGADLACDACHGLPPGSGAHEEHTENYDIDCNVCHDGYSADNSVNGEVHIDGNYDVKLSAEVGGSYAGGVCSNVICHGAGNTPNW
ncbi:CxxxxCH/CxxCH domain-containing protein, partial [candidate division KSB1 bacterium]|nr:CxxxxCH/CxxCH domain-containing protein [candidate division KSB1 bacterium]